MTDVISGWGLWGIAAMYALEALGVPWPIEIPLWLSGQILQQGANGYWQLVLVTWLGTSSGNLLAFTLARLGGRRLLATMSDRLHIQDQVNRAQSRIDRYGIGAVVVTRWINWGFALSLWLVGFSKIPPGRTIAVILINNALWASAWVELGQRVAGVLNLAGLPSWLMLVPGGIFLVSWGVWLLWRKHTAQLEGTR